LVAHRDVHRCEQAADRLGDILPGSGITFGHDNFRALFGGAIQRAGGAFDDPPAGRRPAQRDVVGTGPPYPVAAAVFVVPDQDRLAHRNGLVAVDVDTYRAEEVRGTATDQF
jgi:hypothetical protein